MTDHFRDDVIGPDRWPDREGISYERYVRIVQEARILSGIRSGPGSLGASRRRFARPRAVTFG
ncbi:MAG: hypothetical protein H0T57_04110 [Rubrobacter sp.]|nr:hypothetical protein [Rubrobacter sp.]